MKYKVMRALLAVAIIFILAGSSLVSSQSVLAKEENKNVSHNSLITNKKVRVNAHTEIECVKINYDKKNQPVSAEYEATVSTLPATTDNGEEIDTTWYKEKDSSGHSYFEAGNNLFTALVTIEGRASTQGENNKIAAWTPVVSIGTDVLSCSKPKILAIDPRNDFYKKNVLEWTYTLKNGIFNTNTVTVKRWLRLIEGSIIEYYIIDGDPKGDVVVMPNLKTEEGAINDVSEVLAFDSSDRIAFLKVESLPKGFIIRESEFKNKIYPIIIDPTTTFNGMTSDANIHARGADGVSYSTVWAQSTANGVNSPENGDTHSYVGQSMLSTSGGDSYYIDRSFIFFDTTALPDNASITAAWIELYVTYIRDNGTNKAGITIQSGMPTYPHSPVVNGDYNKSYYSGNGGSKNSSEFSTQQYNYIGLNSVGYSMVNKTGTTKFCLRSPEDISGNAPADTGASYSDYTIGFWQTEHGSGYAPKLVVSYYVPITPPSVTTMSAFDIDETSMVLKGYLSDDGGESCIVKFQYGTTTAYGLTSGSVSGATSGDYFVVDITGLSRGTTYHYRTIATNSAGTNYGLDVTGTTLPSVPSGFTATAGNGENDLAWTKGAGSDKTLVRFKTTGYPSSITDGTQIYFDTLSTYNHPGLTATTPYYYSIWAEQNGEYSLSHVTAFAVPFSHDAPNVSTLDATGIGVTTATLNGNLSALNQAGGSVTVSFEYGETDAYGDTAAGGVLSSPGAFSADIATLNVDTLYHFRAKADGDNGIGYGTDLTFTTGAAGAPTMSTEAAAGVGLTYATLNGKVSDDGDAVVTAWFNWGLSSTNLDQTSPTASGLYTDDVFYYGLSELSANTTYYFESVGLNSAGTAYGATANFTTSSLSVPSVTTNEASDIGANKATLSGVIASDGGGDCEVQFEWDTDSGAPYASATGWQSGFAVGESFEAFLSGLTVGDTYYFRASVKNTSGTAYGVEKTLETVFVAPSDFIAKSVGATTVSLSWAKQGDQTYIVYKTSGYPVDRLDGDQVYFGDAGGCTHDGLSPGITYFYRAWSWREGDVWSGGYSEDAATTLPVRTEEEKDVPDIQGIPDMPDSMYQEPDETGLANLPGYDAINAGADEIGMPREMFWLMVSMGVLLVLGLIIFVPTGSVMLSAIIIGFGTVIACATGAMPMWMLVVFAILTIGLLKFFGTGAN